MSGRVYPYRSPFERLVYPALLVGRHGQAFELDVRAAMHAVNGDVPWRQPDGTVVWRDRDSGRLPHMLHWPDDAQLAYEHAGHRGRHPMDLPLLTHTLWRLSVTLSWDGAIKFSNDLAKG